MSNLHDAWLTESARISDESADSRRSRQQDLRNLIDSGRAGHGHFLELAGICESFLEDDTAVELLREAVSLWPVPETHLALVDALSRFNQADAAIQAAAVAGRLFPHHLIFRLKEGLTLPAIYEDVDHAARCRAWFRLHLRQILSSLTLTNEGESRLALEAVARHQNFYLPYQMEDDRELQVQYSQVLRSVINSFAPELLLPNPQAREKSGSTVRVGYVSANLHRHANSRAFGAWILERTKTEFEAFVYYVGGSPEKIRDDIRRSADEVRYLNGDFGDICRVIRQDQLDAVIFIDVGMHPMMHLLASARFAPVQCVTWGHPVTTGSPNVDFFLSAELMDPPDGDRHYSERLIRLPGIGVNFPKPLLPRTSVAREREQFGFEQSAVVYLCWQSGFKYHPRYDDIFPAIAAGVPNARFIFQSLNPAVERVFRNRLHRAFGARGLKAEDHCIFLPFLSLFEYSALILASDICLDSLGFCGFTTIMEAVAGRLPVVTLPGQYQKGRQCAAVMTQLGVIEMIAATVDEYVDMAIRLGLDEDWREQVALKMAKGERALFSDSRSVVALEAFLRTAVAESFDSKSGAG